MTGRGIVTLTTDFGLRDGYVAAMKGAMLARAPELRLVDVTHEVAPGAIALASFVLEQAAPHFPPDTVHLVVVDPGVGGTRRALAGRIGAHLYVAPDNGVLTRALARDPEPTVRSIESPELAPADASPVFHGRDVFGPTAAHLAAGGALDAVGPRLDPATLVREPMPEPLRTAGGAGEVWTGAVIHTDRFGNLITNLAVEPDFAARATVEVSGVPVPAARTYGDVPDGALVALRGSTGLLEIARRGGSASEATAAMGTSEGLVIELSFVDRS